MPKNIFTPLAVDDTALNPQTAPFIRQLQFFCVGPSPRALHFCSVLPEPPEVGGKKKEIFCEVERPCRPSSGLSRASPRGSALQGTQAVSGPNLPQLLSAGLQHWGSAWGLLLGQDSPWPALGIQVGAELVPAALCLAHCAHAPHLQDRAASRWKSQGSSTAK